MKISNVYINQKMFIRDSLCAKYCDEENKDDR